MRLCHRLITRKKQHNIIYQGIQTWTELCYQDRVLCNDLDGAHFIRSGQVSNPEQLSNCEACGEWGCGYRSEVNISRLGDHILWGPPAWDAGSTELVHDGRLPELDEWGSLLIPISVWRDATGSDTSSYPTTTRRDLMLSWLLEYDRLDSINSQQEMLAKIRQRLIGGNNLDLSAVNQCLEQLVAWFEAVPGEPLTGKMILAGSVSARVETLILQDPAQEWPAFAVTDGQIHPTFGDGWMYFDGV